MIFPKKTLGIMDSFKYITLQRDKGMTLSHSHSWLVKFERLGMHRPAGHRKNRLFDPFDWPITSNSG